MRPTTEQIRSMIEDYFKMEPEQLKTKSRKREIVQPRQIAMYFAKLLTRDSLAQIGFLLGGKGHATVMHACKTVTNLVETDKNFRKMIQEITQKINDKYPAPDERIKDLETKTTGELIQTIVVCNNKNIKLRHTILQMKCHLKLQKHFQYGAKN